MLNVYNKKNLDFRKNFKMLMLCFRYNMFVLIFEKNILLNFWRLENVKG